MQKNYYLSRNYTEEGPYGLAHIRALYETGRLGTDVYIRKEGESEWLPLHSFLNPGDAPPPPLPLQAQSHALLPPPALPAWRSLKGCGVTMQCLLALLLPIHIWGMVRECQAIEVFDVSQENGISFDEALIVLQSAFEQIDRLSSFIVTANILLAIVSLFWFYKCAVNANRMAQQAQSILGKASPLVKPGMFLISFFIPVYGWIKPYLDMQRVYNVSTEPENARVNRFSGVVAVWWAPLLFLLFFTLWTGDYIERISSEAETQEAARAVLEECLALDLALFAVQIFAIASFFFLIRRVGAAQARAMQAPRCETPDAS